MNKEKVKPFDSFILVFKILALTGYFKLLDKPNSKLKWKSHLIYRMFAFLMIFVFNLQHLTYTALKRHDIDAVFDSLMIGIPQINLFVKFITLNLQASRIYKIQQLLNDPIFSSHSKKDEELLLKNSKDMHRLYKIINMSITMAVILWPASHFARRYQDKNAVVPSYIPFDTDTWGKYSLSVLMEVSPVFWLGYGHLAIDCLVSAYYAQAEVQLKIIKHNLEHLFNVNIADVSNTNFRYRDIIDATLKTQFVHYVRRFEKLAWYVKEIDDVFGPAMSFQFFTSTAALCMVTYRMSYTPVGSVPFIFMVLVLFVISTQVFLYCYFGNLVQYESQSLVSSLYLSEWLSVSPKFRRMLLIGMLRWSRTLTPTVSGIVPLSLNTFVSILRATYSLYAVLGTRKS